MKKMFKTLAVMGITFSSIASGLGGFNTFASQQPGDILSKLPEMTYEETLSYIIEDYPEALIAVGIIQDGKTSYTLYSENDRALSPSESIFEIGSLTKTFNGALLFKAAEEGKVNLDDSIDKYLTLPEKDYYPTLKRLVTHTSGYENNILNASMPLEEMIAEIYTGKNILSDFSKEDLIRHIGEIDLEDRDYGFNYSNFGAAVVGAVLSEVYNEDYTGLMNRYVQEELGLEHTQISDGTGNLSDYWTWLENDAYTPAGALTSNLEDIMKYAQMQMNETNFYMAKTHDALAEIDLTEEPGPEMEIGGAWIINKDNVIWHNGGTGHYSSYLGFDREKQIAVVILSNLPVYYPIQNPTTVLGEKLLGEM